MPLTDLQFSINSLTMGPGTKYNIIRVTGLYDGVTSANDLNKLGGGTFAARDDEAGKPVTFDIQVMDTPGAAFAATIGAFIAAWPVKSTTDVTLQWKIPGITNERKLTGRTRRRAFPVDPVYEMGLAVIVCEFFATDPQVYDATTSAAVDY